MREIQKLINELVNKGHKDIRDLSPEELAVFIKAFIDKDKTLQVNSLIIQELIDEIFIKRKEIEENLKEKEVEDE